MKYVIEDTHTGYRLSIVDSVSGTTRHFFVENGGHGPMEKLYEAADLLWIELRQK